MLGGDEGKECTYAKGYMKRQAIFSCLTCTPNGNAGVCIACSLSCHDGHEVVYLTAKLSFFFPSASDIIYLGFCGLMIFACAEFHGVCVHGVWVCNCTAWIIVG